MESRHSRRRFVKALGGTAAVGAVGSLSGCSGVPLVGGGGSPGYAKWVPEPGDVGAREHQSAYLFRAPDFRNNEDNFDESVYESLSTYRHESATGVEFDELSKWFGFGSVSIVSGSFSISDVKEELGDNDYDDEDELQGYTLYLGPNQRQGFAVGNGKVIAAPRYEDPIDVLETTIETKSGQGDRYLNESDAFRKLVSTLGTGSFVTAQTQQEVTQDAPQRGQFEHAVGRGTRYDVNGETISVKLVVVFEEADDYSKSDFEDWVDASDQFDDYDDVSHSQSGRAGVITATVPTDEWRI